MCLAVPGKIEAIHQAGANVSPTAATTVGDALLRMASVNFGGVRQTVNLACVPEAGVGDYVLVHVGCAISVLQPAEAQRVFAYLEQLNEEEPGP